MEEPGVKIGVENVRRATRAAMIAAARHGFEIIAIPGMGTGLGGVDPDDAARAIVDELRAHKQAKPSTVYLVDLKDEILACLEDAFREATGQP
jgi:O-acetyl-ADP-ribose deacetylase (regulator of RNase III)